MQVLIILLLLGLFSGSVLLESARRKVPVNELRRRARSQADRQSRAIYKLAVYGEATRLFLWITGSFSAAGLLLIAASFSWWLLIVSVLAMGWLAWKDYDTLRIGGWQWKIAAVLAKPTARLVSFLLPLLGRAGNWLESKRIFSSHSGVYEKEDLVELLKKQKGQMDNRISESELKIARGGLTFADKTVGSIMTPRRVIKMVAASDTIGPHLMDELHASGFSRFPVAKEPSKSTNSDIIGLLYLRDLLNHEQKGRVADVMKKKVYFINEAQNLKQALAAFLTTEHHLLVVVNNFEEIVGVLSLEDVLEQILGERIVDEFDRYDDMREVAGLEAEKDKPHHTTVKN